MKILRSNQILPNFTNYAGGRGCGCDCKPGKGCGCTCRTGAGCGCSCANGVNCGCGCMS